jgi:outer membrane immunogenic protein
MKGRQMRWVICALLVLGFGPRAFAQDFDILRGSETVGPATFTNWSGFYVGGQFSYSDANADFSKATQPLVASSLIELALEADATPSQWPVLGRASNDATGFGGFVGYNTQWQNLILGVEGNFTHSPMTVTASDSPILDRVVGVGSLGYSVNLLGTGTLSLTDYGSLRARAGYVINNFLPYGFAGVVVGSGNYAVTTEIYGQQSSASPPVLPCAPSATCVDYDFANSVMKNGVLMYGFSVGGGLDYALTQNMFLRGEFEYVQFAPIGDIVASIITARVGAGVKF